MIEALQNYDALSLSSLRLLVSPLQLMSAALWGVLQNRAVLHYGLLEDFITAVLDLIPGLLSLSERDQLVLGLRATVVSELCRSDDLCCRQNIEPHLTRIDDLLKVQRAEEVSDSKIKASLGRFVKEVNMLLYDPYKREEFYQEIIPSVFSLDFDSSLCALVRKFLINLEKLLPVPTLEQTSLWLGLSPPVLKECGDILNQRELLNELIQHHKQDSYLSAGPFVNDFIFSSLFDQQEGAVTSESLYVKEEKSLEAEVTEDDAPSVEVTLDESDSEPQTSNDVVANVDLTSSANLKTYRCLVCGQTFSSLFKLQKHIIPRCPADTFGNSISKVNNTFSRRKKQHVPKGLVIPADTTDGQMCKKRSNRIKSCSVCGQIFTSSAAFITHMRTHFEDGAHICSQCGKQFDTYENDMSHQKNGCKCSMSVCYKMYGIRECSVVLPRVSDNMTISPPVYTVSCKDCGEKVPKSHFKIHQRKCSRRRRLRESPVHIKNEDLIRIKPCKFTSLSKLGQIDFETDPETKVNQSSGESQITSTQPSLYCTLCDETFFTMVALRKHYENAHEVKGPYQCPVCTRHFVRLLELVKHHNDVLQFQCKACKMCFRSCGLLKKHIQLFKEACGSTYVCEVCGKSCKSLAVFKYHKQSHDKPTESTVCSYCGKQFSSKYCLRVHMNRHTGGFPCSLCPKVYNQMIYLKRHMHIHNGTLQPFLCEVCGKDWPTKGNLRVHMLEHSQERPFKCDQCDQSYKKRHCLKSHIISKHSQSKPYVCSICGAGHKSSRVLKEHMMRHTGDKPHACSKCGKRFVRLYHLKVHHKTCLYKWKKL